MNRDAEASDLRTVSMLDPDQCKGILPSSNASSPSSSMSTLLASSSHIIPLQSAEASLQTMLQIYHSLNFPSPSLPPIERRRPVYNTILLSGAAGSGKTSLLQSFASFINSASINKSSPTPLRVYYHSFKTSPLSLNESTTAAILAMIHSFEESPHDFKLFAELLASFLLAIDERNTSLSPSCLDSPSSPFVLLLDDVDAVLQALPRHFFNDVLESSAFDNTNSLQSSDTSLMASALKVIVSTIEIFNFPLLIIGATALTPSSLATCSAQGSIKFEKLILVQKPTSHDRKLLLLEMLKALIRDCGKLAAKEVSNIEKDNTDEWRSIWALQLAKLTPGYLPGDLKMLCRKICSLHKGSALRKATRSEEVVRKEMDWSLALKALSLTPPAQLHHLKDFIHVEDVFEEDVDSNTVNCGHTRESFMPAVRGYAEAKEKLRRIVKQISLAAGSNPLLPRGSLRSGIVLYGPSGNGKSLVAKCIAKEVLFRCLSANTSVLIIMAFYSAERKIFSNSMHGAVVEVLW